MDGMMDDRAADYHLGPLERSRPHRRTGCCLRRYSTDAHDPIRRAAPTRRPPILAGPQRFPVVAIRWVSLVAGFRSRGRRSSGTVAWRIVFFFFYFSASIVCRHGRSRYIFLFLRARACPALLRRGTNGGAQLRKIRGEAPDPSIRHIRGPRRVCSRQLSPDPTL